MNKLIKLNIIQKLSQSNQTKILNQIPHTAWLKVLEHLGLYSACLLRNVDTKLKTRIDETIRQIYYHINGKCDLKMSRFFGIDFIYPKINFKEVMYRHNNYEYLKTSIQLNHYSSLMNIIKTKNLFSFKPHKQIIDLLHLKKLKKAIKLVLVGLSDHYTVKCMELKNERINWAIQLKSQDICDIFCYRAAAEFNENQVKNLLKVQKYTFQDCFAFSGAKKLNNEQIDVVIGQKQLGKLDAESLEFAGCIDIFDHGVDS